ncbi:hypothetical protein [Cytobacillus firmus]|nr:hypothetical protein [Cytobacillus firmus]MCS0671325.1 hypothetical protein [Cytobacillus firmus]
MKNPNAVYQKIQFKSKESDSAGKDGEDVEYGKNSQSHNVLLSPVISKVK